MELEIIPRDFSVCKVESIGDADLSRGVVFLSVTPDEVSLVCETPYVPQNAFKVESGWKAFRVSGELDFGLIGILAKISGVLADAGISIFAVSTFNTDYVLVKAESFKRGLQVLGDNGFKVLQGDCFG